MLRLLNFILSMERKLEGNPPAFSSIMGNQSNNLKNTYLLLGKQPCTEPRCPSCGGSPRMARKRRQQHSRRWCRRCRSVLPSCDPRTPWGWSAHHQTWRCGSAGALQSWCGWWSLHAPRASSTCRMPRRTSCNHPSRMQTGPPKQSWEPRKHYYLKGLIVRRY